MARKKYFEDEENQGQSCCQEGMTMAKTQFHPNQNGNLLLNSKNPLSSLANKQTLHQPNHNQSHNKKKNVTLDLGTPKNSEESFYAVVQQLSGSGLTIREMPGDGNCLFRALADQLEGHPRNHLDHRRAVVQYMRENRPDFEPFVEDDEPFEKYVQTLAQPGTFAGNDVIVAFARLHNVTVVIHQLNTPAWLIHPSKDEHPSSGREVHIAYHNGDHYNSVRKLGDESDGPANIKFSVQGHSGCTKSAINMSGKNSPPHTAPPSLVTVPGKTSSSVKDRSNSPGRYDHMLYGLRDEDFWVKDSSDVDRLVEDVMQKTGYQDPSFVRETLIDFNFDMISTVDHIVRMSFFFCQTHERQDAESGVDNQQPNQASLDMESQNIEPQNIHEQVTHLNENDDGSGKENSSESGQSEIKCLHVMQPHSREPHSPTTQPEIDNLETGVTLLDSQNQDQENLNKVNPKKLSTRRKKELKKKERKRDADQRKKKENEPPSEQIRPAGFIPAIRGTLTI